MITGISDALLQTYIFIAVKAQHQITERIIQEHSESAADLRQGESSPDLNDFQN